MTKATGLGQLLVVDEFDVSGDTQALARVGGGPNLLDHTSIAKSAHERLGGLLDGALELTSYFNDAAGAAHAAYLDSGAIGAATRVITYGFRTRGGVGALITPHQANYDGTRAADGMLTFDVSAMVSGGVPLQWGRMLTASEDSDTAGETETGAGDLASIDRGASLTSTDFGLQASLHVTAFSGTDATITIEDSADDAAFASVAAFTQVTDVGSEYIESGSTENVRRYLRASVSTSGGFTSMTFAVCVVVNDYAVRGW